MQYDSPQQPATAIGSGFTEKVFEDLQTDYPKDPARFAKMYNHLKADSDDVLATQEDRTDSRQNLCLLDLAVASIKAKAGDRQEASIMYNDAMTYLNKLNSQPAGKTTLAIRSIAKQVEKKISP